MNAEYIATVDDADCPVSFACQLDGCEIGAVFQIAGNIKNAFPFFL